MLSLRQGKSKEIKNTWTRMLFDCETVTENSTLFHVNQQTDYCPQYKVLITFPFC